MARHGLLRRPARRNAASHVAFGHALPFAVNADDGPRLNSSEIHIDFMIGSDEVTVSGITEPGAS
jgi:aminopeptidase